MLEKKLRELPDDQEKVLFAQVTQLLEGRSTVVELKDPKNTHWNSRSSPWLPEPSEKQH